MHAEKDLAEARQEVMDERVMHEERVRRSEKSLLDAERLRVAHLREVVCLSPCIYQVLRVAEIAIREEAPVT